MGDRADKGIVAPIALRDIVHPARMSSQAFKLHYSGNCFTCHNVGGDGNWHLLTEKVEVNEKGVPADYEKLHIQRFILRREAYVTLGKLLTNYRLCPIETRHYSYIVNFSNAEPTTSY